ncbi:MAG: hypothetical protein JXC36_03645 [Candidatus Atribacteria bacterium]|nr:hypothetical protein [Candidatus Atribacteria bacterium]
MKKESPTVQLGLRIEKSLLKQIEFFADANKVDKMSLIRQAIASYVDEMEDAFQDQAIEDYISGRIDEKELKEDTDMKTIPADIQEARKETLKHIVNKRIKGD